MNETQKQNKLTLWQLLRPNFSTLLLFQFFYSSAGALIMIPLFYLLFRGAMTIGGFHFLAPHNLGAFLGSPFFWIAVILLLLIAALYSLLNIGAVIYTCECGRQQRQINLRILIREAFKSSTLVLKPKNWLMILVILVIIPLMNIGVTPCFLGAITIPDFIMDFILQNKLLFVLAGILGIVLLLLILRWLYAFNYVILEKKDFKEARKASAVLGKKHHIRDLLSLIGVQLLVMAVAGVILGIGLLILSLLVNAAGNTGGIMAAFLSGGMGLLATFLVFIFLIVTLIGMPVCYANISLRYYRYRKETDDPAPMITLNIPHEVKKSKGLRVLGWIGVIFLVAALSFIMFTYSNGSIQEIISASDVKTSMGDDKTGVVAHRCGPNYAPENTIAALNNAADMGASWCEIDVQQTKDGALIIMHDTNFKRTTGMDADAWDLTLEEVKKLDAGKDYGEKYAGEQIPTLDEIIKAAKARGVKLQIEVKLTGHENRLTEAVADTIVTNDYVNECLIASLDYSCLETARQYNPNIQTLYIMSMAFGDIEEIEAATDFSIESTWISDTLVDHVHDHGDQIFAWTINTPSVMQQMINCGVDALVTDNIAEALEVTNDNSSQSLAQWIIDFFDLRDIKTEI